MAITEEIPTIEFEPGASVPLFLSIEQDNGEPADVLAVTAKLSLNLGGNTCADVTGVYDPERNGFVFDLDPLAALIVSKSTIKSYLYISWGQGFDRAGVLKLKPLEGCVWRVPS